MKFVSPFLFVALGGLIYQLGRFLLGMRPTWDTFLEVTLFVWGVMALVLFATRKYL